MHDKSESSSPNSPSNAERGALKQEWITELMDGAKTTADLFGPDGVFTRLKAAVMERMLQAELDDHLGYERNARPTGSNRRNGSSAKTVQTETGPVTIQVPRDREGTFEPRAIPKHRRRLEGFDEKVLALYARGMTVRDIQGHLRELYGTEVSPELISRVTDSVLDEMRAWQNRPLETLYPIVYLDALFVHVRDGAQVIKKAVYVALGVNPDGARDVLGLWIAESEGARFWLSVLTDLRNRGVQDVWFVCADGLSGLPDAIAATFPKSIVQTCIVHLIRSSLRFVSQADRKPVVAMLRTVYSAENAQMAEAALEKFDERWGGKYPTVTRSWRARWREVIPFLAYPPEVRRILYTTNVIESLNFQLRKVTRPRGHFPSDDAVLKVLFMALKNARLRWRRPASWHLAMAQFSIMFEDRLPA